MSQAQIAEHAKEKLLLVINHIDWFWSHRLPLAKGAQKAGYDVHVAVNGAQNNPKLPKNNFIPHHIGTFIGPICAIFLIFRLKSILKSQKIDVIHAITLKYCFVCGILSIFHENKRFVHTIAGLGYVFSGEGVKPRLLRAFLSPLFRLAFRRKNARLIFQNPDDQDIFIKRGFARAHQCHLIRGSGVDLDQFEATPIPQNDPLIALMPTRLVREKGVRNLIEASKILDQKSVRVQIQIAGGPSKTNPLAISEREMNEMLNGSNVKWLGRVDDMPELFASCDFVVYPSYYREGVPKVLLEACASGRAIITTDHPGCRETVRGSENGTLVPIKDPQALAEAMKSFCDNKDQLQKMGTASRKLAEEIFDVKEIVKQTLSVYNYSP